ncbi:hypothetical protein H8A97_10095 [Bradyrhizobium sp. Arg62]|uniref:hypothetical protein n=1 Tax=Bradyrhizobium brasilense TaxID=1419277 RepID=UPI001E5560FC|nr:hypothetical protein [Bradyrhizobium brasilense]MCC8945442.1 hypothetical protein [Bradyrhizobium brasilense]
MTETQINPEPYQEWVTKFRHFYREFPIFVDSRYARALKSNEDFECYTSSGPQVWKTIGDEILFCCRVQSHEHLSACISAFLGALDDYGRLLDQDGKRMDVKGAAWIAAFPAPNVTVEIAGKDSQQASSSDQIDEEFELSADSSPSDFDFLGQQIDSGFRTAKNAAPDRCSLSIELAWLLAEAAHSEIFPAKFSYYGRHPLKGVIHDRPYPIIAIDAERSLARREVRKHERAVTREGEVECLHLRNFLESFMKDEGIELPILFRHGIDQEVNSLPQTYRDFEAAWSSTNQENQSRRSNEVAAVDAEDGTSELPASVNANLEAAVAQAERPTQ